MEAIKLILAFVVLVSALFILIVNIGSIGYTAYNYFKKIRRWYRVKIFRIKFFRSSTNDIDKFRIGRIRIVSILLYLIDRVFALTELDCVSKKVNANW
jgi:thiol:disulfide interchange protein